MDDDDDVTATAPTNNKQDQIRSDHSLPAHLNININIHRSHISQKKYYSVWRVVW